ncbi:MAG: glycosyltransferase family 2 protein [bacterium]
MKNTAIIVPNWNGKESLGACLDSLLVQSVKSTVIVVENASTDGSLEYIKKSYPAVELVVNKKNLGFAGGVNSGIKRALELKCDAVALFNNDAVADKNWLETLVAKLKSDDALGIVTGKLMGENGVKLDSTGDQYTVWGLPYPRGRGEKDAGKYDKSEEVFAASGGASLYRATMLKEIGLFDEDFFAYYEDVDISFRAQLAGWKVVYEPAAVAYHQIGATSSKIKGFTTYQTMKNLQLLWYKNMPKKFMYKTGWRFFVAHTLFLFRAISRGQGISAIKGDLVGSWLLVKKSGERKKIQASKKVSDEYVWSIMTHDLPPNAKALRSLRRKWWKITGNKNR